MSLWNLAAFLLILALPTAIFVRWQLPFTKRLWLSVSRMTLQLLVVGFYLQTLFEWQSLWVNGIWFSIMIVVAAHSIATSAKLPLKQTMPVIAMSLSMILVCLLPVILVLVVEVSPWWQAQYLIPITGMLLGNALSANIVGLQCWREGMTQGRAEYEYYLSMGAAQPQQPFLRLALAKAMAPQLATMATLGIVSLPGMMTGQILAGAEPMQAVQYQIMIMVAIFVSASCSVALTLSALSFLGKDGYGRYLSMR
ncbi:ABC transporter permease [Thaumasiovibrio subtropicus]|uniref:ABC transporter permease n=1 Tax=Thaumasiovibrio subtropicus TaxID=1891207 RepID=UPI000B35F739|nr:ABC transporter permease [Thaumasiovibrio subtropicus]